MSTVTSSLERWLGAVLQDLDNLARYPPRMVAVEAAREALEFAQRSLPARAQAEREMQDVLESARPDRDATAMLRVMAYLASSWSIYDQMALALCRLHGHDGQLPMKDVLKCDRGRQPMASLVGEPMRRYRWSVSTSYAVRNAVLHGGATATEHRLCEGLRIRGPALLVEESCVLELAKTCRERYGATESETRTPWSWKMPIGEVLRRCHEDADELFGICLCLSTRMVGNIEAILEFREPPAAEVSQAARKRTT